MDNGPIISTIDEHEWVEVKAQSHGGVRRSVWEKFLEWSPERMVIYARYDPGVVVERHATHRTTSCSCSRVR